MCPQHRQWNGAENTVHHLTDPVRKLCDVSLQPILVVCDVTDANQDVKVIEFLCQ